MRRNTFMIGGVGLLITFILSGTAEAQQWYVDIDAQSGGDGSTWALAWDDLNDALQFAEDNPTLVGEIWVAEGTYLPDVANPGNRGLSFDLTGLDGSAFQNGLQILGGFEGTETSASQRNATTHVTILSGDLDGDDGANFANRSDNSYHVVFAEDFDASVTLDGFTIRGGNADGTSLPEFIGGGVLVLGIGQEPGGPDPVFGPRISNCIIEDNLAQWCGGVGGKVAADLTRLQLINCTIRNNEARALGTGAGRGGGVHGIAGILRNCTIESNVAEGDGGGVWMNSDDNLLLNCRVVNNQARNGGRGGGAFLQRSADVVSSYFADNTADCGGGALQRFGQHDTHQFCVRQ